MEIDPHNLPEDAHQLQRMLLHTLAQLDSAQQRLVEKEREFQKVRHWLEQLLRHRYGQKRERVDENQLFMFAVELAGGGHEPPAEPQSESKKPAKPHGRRKLPKSLARRRVVYELAEAERQCPQ